MAHLNLQQLTVRDYRCFKELSVSFHPQLTVLVAPNGAGKTAILDAVAVAFGPFISSFDEGVGRHFHPNDIRLSRVRETVANEMEFAPDGVHLEATGIIPHEREALPLSDQVPTTWRRALAGPTKAKTTIKDAKDLINLGKRLQKAVRTPGENASLPLLAYYGTGRLWQQKKLLKGKLPRTSRTIGYTDCLDPASSYKALVAWFRYWYVNSRSDRITAQEAGRPYRETEFDAFLRSVSAAVETCLEPVGWKNLSYSLAREELVAHHEHHGELAVEQLSDGIRNMIALVADIAFRATKLNPQFGAEAARKTSGIVLIDEVDMHLHPQWQQVVLQNLTSAFPRVQFIVTTHSPQVLSTVRRENIRVIGQDSQGMFIAAPPLAMTYGEPSGDVMHSVMLVDPQPPVSEKADLHRLTELVDQGLYATQEAMRLMERLQAALHENHPQLQRLRRSIQRQEALRG